MSNQRVVTSIEASVSERHSKDTGFVLLELDYGAEVNDYFGPLTEEEAKKYLKAKGWWETDSKDETWRHADSFDGATIKIISLGDLQEFNKHPFTPS